MFVQIFVYTFLYKNIDLKMFKDNIWMCFILISLITGWTNVRNKAFGQQISSSNTPPVMYVEQHWRISEVETVGSIIARVRAEDAENDILQFGLEPHYLNTGKNMDSYPFRIDPSTGVVYLNETLIGRGGENFFLYITVTDGQLTAKNEVYVNIINRGDKSKIYDTRTPSFTQTVRNLSQVLPPFHMLPGVINNRPHNNIVQSFPTPIITTSSSREIIEEKENNTVLKPVGNPPNSPFRENIPTNNSNMTNHILDYSDNDTSSFKIVLGLFLALLAVFIVAMGIALYLKGRRTFSNRFNKKGKNEIKQKPNLSNNFTSNTDESHNSIVLNNWIGPIASHNRYVPWERENQQATSQFDVFNSNNNDADPWEFPRHKLKFFNILGEGAFGQVWRCEAININGNEGITTVAVKTLKENATELERKDLKSELQVMKSLDPHTNVVRFLGCCTEKDPLFVIIEYINCGKLQSYLRNSRAERNYGNTHGKSNVLTSADLTSFMYQVAKGMDYLTSKGIIHRDLAARNILITDDHTCKVADFGFARDVIESKIYERKSEGKLPIRWMAIESLYDNLFSVKSDIWSFGILMWEIVTLGSTPYPGISAADVMKKVRDGYRLEKPDHCRRELYNIMYYTWAKDPSERPSFAEIVQMLDKLLHTEMEYIELERFPDHNYYNIVNLSGEKL